MNTYPAIQKCIGFTRKNEIARSYAARYLACSLINKENTCVHLRARLQSSRARAQASAARQLGYFAQQGAKLILVGRRNAELELLVGELSAGGTSATALVGDVRDEQCASTAVAMATERYGGLDIAFNNAGTLGPMAATTQVSAEAWQDALDTNLSSAFLGAKHQIPAMLARGKGSIIFTSSFVGYTIAFPMMAAYAASKAGVVGLTQALAVELGASGIRVNAILPGGTDTPMGRAVANTADARRFTEGLHALKRLAEPEEIAQSVLYLASDASSFTTGTALLVDGGVSINRS